MSAKKQIRLTGLALVASLSFYSGCATVSSDYNPAGNTALMDEGRIKQKLPGGEFNFVNFRGRKFFAIPWEESIQPNYTPCIKGDFILTENNALAYMFLPLDNCLEKRTKDGSAFKPHPKNPEFYFAVNYCAASNKTNINMLTAYYQTRRAITAEFPVKNPETKTIWKEKKLVGILEDLNLKRNHTTLKLEIPKSKRKDPYIPEFDEYVTFGLSPNEEFYLPGNIKTDNLGEILFLPLDINKYASLETLRTKKCGNVDSIIKWGGYPYILIPGELKPSSSCPNYQQPTDKTIIHSRPYAGPYKTPEIEIKEQSKK
ncbi:MAG: hypothetical protein ACOYT4_04700 [Nanoarchaeota archaeon]